MFKIKPLPCALGIGALTLAAMAPLLPNPVRAIDQSPQPQIAQENAAPQATPEQVEQFLHDTSVILDYFPRNTESEERWLNLGRRVCQELTKGTAVSSMLGHAEDLEKVTLSAATNLCPEHREAVFGYRNSREYWNVRDQNQY